MSRLRRRPVLGAAAVALIAGAVGAAAVFGPSDDGEDGNGGTGATPSRAAPASAAARAVVRRAQALVGVRPQDLGYRLVIAGPVPGIRGETDRAARTITLFVDARQAAHRVAHDLAHEIGHAYDDRHLTGAQRRAWLRARDAAGTPWSPGGTLSDYASGAGDFAEVYARCHAASPDFRSRLGPPPVDACALLPPGAR